MQKAPSYPRSLCSLIGYCVIRSKSANNKLIRCIGVDGANTEILLNLEKLKIWVYPHPSPSPILMGEGFRVRAFFGEQIYLEAFNSNQLFLQNSETKQEQKSIAYAQVN